jgi:hypothetical protein
MKRLFIAAVCLLPLAAQSQKKTESFWEKVLRIAGVSATPAALRGEDSVASGDIWLVMVAPKSLPLRLTRGGGYHSPVFDSRGVNVLALRGEDLYRISLGGDPPVRIFGLVGVNKLVGASLDDPDQLLVLGQDSQRLLFAAMVSTSAGTLTRVPHNPLSRDDEVMLGQLAGWERSYGNTRLYTEKNEKEGPGGSPIEFTDIYLKRGTAPPINLTSGSGASSCQPSLSADGRRVVFIRPGR